MQIYKTDLKQNMRRENSNYSQPLFICILARSEDLDLHSFYLSFVELSLRSALDKLVHFLVDLALRYCGKLDGEELIRLRGSAIRIVVSTVFVEFTWQRWFFSGALWFIVVAVVAAASLLLIQTMTPDITICFGSLLSFAEMAGRNFALLMCFDADL